MNRPTLAARSRAVRRLVLSTLAGSIAAAGIAGAAMLPAAQPAAAAPCTTSIAQAVVSTTAPVQPARALAALAATPTPTPAASPNTGTGAGAGTILIPADPSLTTTATISAAQLVRLEPDLTLDDLTIRSCDGGYVVSARLRNGEATRTKPYDGGGTIVLERSSGALQNTATPFASNVPAVQLASVKIPALAGGASVTISAISDVRGIFRVRAFSDAPGSVERPAVLPGDGAKVLTRSNLHADSVTVNTALLNFATTNTLGAAQLRLDRDESWVRIPGLYDKTFSIPIKVINSPLTNAYYYLHDVRSDGVQREFKNGGLDICIDFETDETELIGYVETLLGDWDGGAPDGNADPFQVCINIPITFNAQGQRLFFDAANLKVRSNVQWDFNGPLGGYIESEYRSEINGEIEQRFKDLLLEGNVGEQMTADFNDAIKTLVKGARITDFHFDDDALVIEIEN